MRSGQERLIGDEFRIQQIFANLINNALKHTHQGQIEVGLKSIKSSNDLVELFCYVKDTGQGIPKLHVEKLFRRFEQVKCSEGSSGLGLSICKSLCELMNGRISVHTEVNRGTTFYFSVLCECASETILTSPNKVESSLDYSISEEILNKVARELRILVAEDNEVSQKVICQLLGRYGISHVTLCSNGEEALNTLKSRDFDLVFMDHKMPRMDGQEATRHFRQFETENGKNPVYIIALTATASSQARASSFMVGMNAFLTKPIQMEEFHRALLNFVSNK